MKQEDLYRDTCAEVHAATGKSSITVLDYGCGAEKGVSRTILENVLEQRDLLLLYDTQEVQPSRRPNTRVISEALIWSANPVQSDIVNLSYVLCLLPPEEARMLLRDLSYFQHGATLSIVDYTLKHQSRDRVLQLLTANEEQKWRQQMGDAAFLETHMRFSPDGIADLVESAGLRIQKTIPLDREQFRTGIVAVRD